MDLDSSEGGFRDMFHGGKEHCFLCNPSSNLLVRDGVHAKIIAGLGPLVRNYSVISSKEHVPSLADSLSLNNKSIDEILFYRNIFVKEFGNTLMTEHGRVPVCVDKEDAHEGHCYHAHALIFPINYKINDILFSFYRNVYRTNNIHDALLHASKVDHYFMISTSLSDYTILSAPLNVPRQLARTLVANFLGVDEMSDWRQYPMQAEAEKNATSLREIIEGRHYHG